MSFTKLIKELVFGKSISKNTKKLVNNVLAKSVQVLSSDDINAKKALVVEMDGILGKVLADLYGKNTVGENLKKSKQKLHKTTYQKAWEAHKLRNILVHEPDAALESKDLNSAINNFNTVLKALS